MDNTKLNGIGGIINPKILGTISMDMEDDAGYIHHLNFHNVYYFPSAPKLLVSPQTWARDRGEDEIAHEGTYLKVTRKRSILVWDNRKSQRTVLHALGYALPETPINKGQDVPTKFHSMFADFFKEPGRMHACATVAT